MRGRPDLNWYFDEEAGQLAQPRDEPPPARASRIPPPVRRLAPVGRWFLLAIPIAIGLSIWALIEWGEARVRSGIAETLATETWVWSQDDADLVTLGIDPRARADWLNWYRLHWSEQRRRPGAIGQPLEMTVNEIEFFDGELVLAEVIAARPGTPDLLYREHRFYRQVDGVWLRTATNETMWGEPLRIETESFRFVFRERDAEAVNALVAVADEMHRQVYEQLAFTWAVEPARLFVKVQGENAGAGLDRFVNNRLVLLSPILRQIPMEADATQILVATFAEALTRRAVGIWHARWERQMALHWLAMHDATQRWLARTVEPQGQEILQDIGPLQRYTETQGLPTLAALHNLRELNSALPAGWSRIACETVLDYGMQRYGVVTAAALLDALVRHDTWDGFLDAVFGVDAATFEAGWHDYLRREYGLGDGQIR